MPTEADRRLTAAYLEAMPVQAARVLEGLAPADVAECLEAFEPAQVAPAVAAMRAGTAVAALQHLPGDRARDLLSAMEPSAAVAMLRLADPDVRAKLTEGIEGRRLRHLRRAAGYAADVVGAWCDPLAPVWQTDSPAGQVADAVRETPKGPDDPLFLVQADGKFAGCAAITDVMSAPREQPVRRLMRRDVPPVLDTTTLLDAGQHEGWFEFTNLPVIDVRGRFVGVLSRRKLRNALGEGADIAAAAADGDDVVSTATAGTAAWLGLVLEAMLAPRSGRRDS